MRPELTTHMTPGELSLCPPPRPSLQLCTHLEAGLPNRTSSTGIKFATGFFSENYLRETKERSPSKFKLGISFKPFFLHDGLLKQSPPNLDIPGLSLQSA